MCSNGEPELVPYVSLVIILRGFLVDILRGHAKSSECPE